MRTLTVFLKALAFVLFTAALGTAATAATVTGNATMTAFGSATPVSAQGATVRVCLTMVGAPLNCFMPLQSVTVGPEGTYSLTSNPGTFVLQAIFPGGTLMFAESVEFTQTNQVITRDVHLTPIPYTISGRVSGLGAGIAGAKVELKYPGQSTAIISATTNATGDYQLLQVPDGPYDLKASPPSGLLYTTGTANIQIDHASFAQDFTLLPNFSVAGNVTAGGLALAGAEVSLYTAGEGSATGDTPLAAGFTSTVGNYSLPNLPAGTYDLEVSPAVGSAYGLLLVPGVVVSGTGDTRDLVLHNLSGTVTDADTGLGLAGISLRICDAAGCEVSVIATLLTDSTGYYVWSNPPDGSWLLSIVRDGYSPHTSSDTTDGTDKTHDIALEPFKGLTGKVYAGGSPLANATVNLTLSGSAALEDSVTTDATGTYWIWNPPGGVHDMAVIPPVGSSYKAATVVSFQYEPDTRITRDITLSTSGFSIAGKVTGESAGHATGVPGATVKVMSGTTVVGTSVTTANGNYQVNGVNGGSYDVIVTPPSGTAYPVKALRSVVAGSPARGNVQFDVFLMEGAATLTGMVTNAVTGDGIAGVTVDVCLQNDCNNGTSPPVIGTAVTNSSGVYTIGQLPFGTAGLRASLAGFKTNSQSIDLNDTLEQKEIPLTQVYTVSGAVTGSGVALPGATVALYYAYTTSMYGTAVTTNASGQYTLADVAPGVFDLVVTPVNGSAFFRTVVPGVVVQNAPVTRNVTALGVVSGAARYSVKGTVSANGFPALPGVAVKLYMPGQSGSVSSLPAAEATTDASGNYSLGVAPYGTYELQVLAPEGSGYGNQIIANVVVNSAGTTKDITLVTAPASVSGHVSNGDTSESMAGVAVEICLVSTGGGCGSVLATTTTDGDGNYLVTQVPGGSYVARLRVDGFIEIVQALSLSGSNVVSDFTMYKANKVSGTVLGGSAPLPAAMVAIETMGGSPIDTTITDTAGHYALTKVPNGTYRITVFPPDDTPYGETTVEEIIVDDEDKIVDVVMIDKPDEISGEVTDENGQPVDGALVELCEAAAELCTDPIAETTTGPDGSYTLPTGGGGAGGGAGPGAGEGEVCLHITKPGKAVEKFCFVSPGGGQILEHDCVLVPVFNVAGRIFGGKIGLEGALIELFAAGESKPKFSVLSGAGGVYSLAGLGDGIYDIVVTPPEGTQYVRSVVRGVLIAGASKIQDVVLLVLQTQWPKLEGVLRDDDGNPLAGVDVIAQGDALPLGSLLFYGPGRVTTDANGFWSMRVPGGEYSLSVMGPGYSIFGLVPSVTLAGNTTYNLVVPMVDISGYVRNPAGQAVPGTTLTFKHSTATGGINKSVVADLAGHYAVRVPPGANSVLIEPPVPSAFGKQSIALAPPIDADTVRDFTLSAKAELRGVARDLSGRVIAGIKVMFRDAVTGTDLYADVVTDAAGNYRVSLAPANLDIGVSGFGYSVNPLVGVALPAGGLTKDLQVPLIYLSGFVRDTLGNAVAGAQVFHHSGTWDSDDTSSSPLTISADAQGHYSMRILAGNAHTFQLRGPSSSGSTLGTTFVNAGSLLVDTVRDLSFAPLRQVQGVLTDQFGTPLPGMTVWLSRGSADVVRAVTDALGRYSLTAATDTYKMNAYGSQYSVPNLAQLLLNANVTKNLQITLHDFTGKVVDINGVAVGGVGLTFSESWFAHGIEVQSNFQGHFSLRLPTTMLQCSLRPPLFSGFLPMNVPSLSLAGSMSRHFVLTRPDHRAPVIVSKPRATGITQGAAVIVWQTDEPATSSVTVNGVTRTVAGYRTEHSVAVEGLAANTAYTANVSSSDRYENGPTTASVAFTTLAAPDTRAPLLLTGPIVSSITHNHVTVDWTTDEAATTKLVYGIATPTIEVVEAGLRSAHHVELADLAANTEYTLRVLTTDAAGNGPTQSALVTFRTLVAPDTTAPVIVAGPVVTNVTDTTVTIAWETDEPAASGVSLTDGEAHEVVRDESLVTSHEVTVTGLTPATDYTYTVSSTDGSGNGPTLGAPATFRTLSTADTQPPVIVELPRVVGITHQSAVVQWRTDETASSTVEFGLSAAALNRTASDSKLKTQHVVHLTDLAVNTVYFLRVRSVDVEGNVAVSPVISFTTRTHPDAAVPVFTSAPAVLGTTDTTVTIGWETSEPSDYVVTWGVNSIDEHTISDGKRKQKQRVTLTNLQPGETYSFAVTVSDGSGNETRYESHPEVVGSSESGDSIFNFAMAAVGVSEVNATSGLGGFLASLLGDTTAPSFLTPPTVSWTTVDRALMGWMSSEPVSVQVSYGLQGSSERRLTGALTPSMLHAIVLTGLQAGSTYSYEVTLRDVAGNVASVTGTFTAATLADLLAPVLSSVSVADREAGVVLVNLVTNEPVIHEVRFGLSSSALTESAYSLGYDKLQTLALTGLTAGTTHYYKVVSLDAAGNRMESVIRSFVAGAAGQIGSSVLELALKLAGAVVQKITLGAQDFVVSLNEGGLPKPVGSYVLRWYVDGVHVASLDDVLDAQIPQNLMTVGMHTVRAELTDITVPQLSTLRVSTAVTVTPVPTTVTPDLSAFQNVAISITRNGVEISSAPEGAENILLKVTGYNPQPGANHTLRWYLDGVHHPEFDNQLEGIAAFNPLRAGKHTIRLEMTDNAAPTLVTARTSKVVAVSKGQSGGGVGAMMLVLLGALALRRRRVVGNSGQSSCA